MWVIAHPLRLHLWHLLAEGPATASLLAPQVGESRSLVSYHLRMLGRTGAIVDLPELGNGRERWWRREETFVLAPTAGDVEGRAVDTRTLGVFFARDDAARRHFVTGDVPAAWRRGAFVGNWPVALTPDEADELGERLFAYVNALRARPPADGAERALVSISILPWPT